MASAAATNVLLNPEFESDPTGQTTTILGWNSYGGNAYGETGSQAHSGTNYFKVYQAFNGQVNYTGVYQDNISGPGTVYAADGWTYTLSTDTLAGQNVAWIEVTFRDAGANILALYRSELITTNTIAKGVFPKNTWIELPVTNQYNPSTLTVTNYTTALVAPAGTYFIRYQIVFQGDANNSAGSMYFDDNTLTQTSGAQQGNWNIVWSDEFNGTSIAATNWTFDIGNGSDGWGNNELEYYTSLPQNAYVSNGLLNIVALNQSYDGYNYTSARMLSEGLFSCQYGRLEWRAKLPAGTGTWPALWLLGNNINSIGWPDCGEIDVVENNGSNPATVQGSLHSGSDETGYYNFLNGDSVTNFHIYTLDWSTNAILYYVDGHLYETQTGWSDSYAAYPFPFNQPFFIIMNLAIGGNYLSNPSAATINAGTTFPAAMQVDYVRLYNMTAPLQITVNAASDTLTWPTNIVCHLEATTNLMAGPWTNVTGALQPLSLPLSAYGAVYYRLASP
jgi:beta-glucanase (GH16 family)